MATGQVFRRRAWHRVPIVIETSWSRERIEALIAENGFDYQRIELPYGLATRGDDRSHTAREIFPDDLSGQSVLDLGCNTGYFCFEAVRRGAARVVGYDRSGMAIRRARRLADCLGAPVDFHVRDLNTETLAEGFDHVLCLNVLHHLNDPIQVLDRLIACTRRTLAIELAGLSFQTLRRRLGTVAVGALLMRNSPVIYVGRQPHVPGKEAAPKVKYFITPKALDNILLPHSGAFARIERKKSRFKGRFLMLAHKQGAAESALG